MQRRKFLTDSLRFAATAGLAPLLPRLFMSQALAATSVAYKAIVCLFLPGGNDGNNMVIPMDAQYSEYSAARPNLALSTASLNRLIPTSGGRLFGLHPSLANVAALYNSGHAAILANAGPLTAPITRSSFSQNIQVPAQLFSHAAQQAEWQSAITQTDSTTGWAGRIADMLTQNSAIPSVISTYGWSLMGQGNSSAAGATGFGGNTVGVLNALNTMNPILAQMESGTINNRLQATISQMEAGYSATTNALNAAIAAGASLKTVFPATSIGQQLKTIAQIIGGSVSNGTAQQMFFCQDQNSYDTHITQLELQGANLSQIDAAIGAFAAALQELNMFGNVTLFTMTDFARSHQSNSSGGTDHAWGNHHLIVGGPVKGGDIFGQFPSLILGGDNDCGNTGLWIPTTSGSQYAATLARWLGVSTANVSAIFPELANFSSPYLSFL